jgi:hypothetical protein
MSERRERRGDRARWWRASKKSGSGGSSKQGGTTAQKKAARKGRQGDRREALQEDVRLPENPTSACDTI